MLLSTNYFASMIRSASSLPPSQMHQRTTQRCRITPQVSSRQVCHWEDRRAVDHSSLRM